MFLFYSFGVSDESSLRIAAKQLYERIAIQTVNKNITSIKTNQNQNTSNTTKKIVENQKQANTKPTANVNQPSKELKNATTSTTSQPETLSQSQPTNSVSASAVDVSASATSLPTTSSSAAPTPDEFSVVHSLIISVSSNRDVLGVIVGYDGGARELLSLMSETGTTITLLPATIQSQQQQQRHFKIQGTQQALEMAIQSIQRRIQVNNITLENTYD